MKSPFRSNALLLAALALAALGSSPPPLQAQNTGTIQGEVREAGSGRGLSTIQVYAPESGRGTLTNASGRFQLINVPAGQIRIVAQGVGYAASTQTVTVTAGQVATVSFTLNPSAIALDEVVVTGAGQATQVKKLGNTVATIDTRQLETAPVANMSEVLQGREPGVVALPTGGVAGEGTKIRIRGGSSLSQSNEPIIIVDGIRVDNGGGMGGIDQGGGSPSRLDDINPAAIERIEILKGAAAATLYGTEASNGVIQIFTKAGSAGEPRWNLQIEQGFSQYLQDRYPVHAGFARDQAQADRLTSFWGQQIRPYEVFEVDMWPQLFETGRSSTYALSVNGGNEKVTYFLSGRYLGEDGGMQSDGFGPEEPGMTYVQDLNNKKQANANFTFSPWETVRIRANSSYIDGYLEVADNNNNTQGTISNLINSKPERADEANPSGAVPSFGSMREMFYQRTMQNIQRYSGSIGADFTPLEAVAMDLTFGVDLINEQNISHTPFGWNVDGLVASDPTGTRVVRDRNARTFSVDAKTSWNEQLNETFSSSFVVGGQAYYNENLRSGGTGSQFSGPGLEVIEAGKLQEVFEERVSQVSAGVFVQEQIGYDDYLFVTLGARYDKHSAFGESAGGALYPKLSVSLVPSDMPFWTSTAVSSLRLRGAIGQSGLQPKAFDKFTTFEPLNSETGPGVQPNNLGNQDLKPEISTEFEGGVDLGLLEDRVSVTATYWNRRVDDALVGRQFPLSGGFTATQLDNIGKLQSQGVELGVSGMVLNTPRFSLDLFLNGAYLHEKVVDMGGAPDIKLGYFRYGNWIKEGYAPGSFFGPLLVDNPYPIDQNGDGAPDSQQQLLEYFSTPRDPGVIRTVLDDQDGDGDKLDHYLGKPTPDWTSSFGGTLTFLQNFKLSTLFEYKGGNFQWHNLTGAFRRSHALIGRNVRKAAEVEATLMNPASTAEQRVEAARIWATELAALSPQDVLNEVEDADFVRWRELSLSYRVPASMIERFGMNNLELTVGGRNIALWTGYSGVDPELNVVGGRSPDGITEENNFLTGVEGWGFGMPRRLSLSATIGF